MLGLRFQCRKVKCASADSYVPFQAILLLATQVGSLSHVRIVKKCCWETYFQILIFDLLPQSLSDHRSCTRGLGMRKHGMFHFREDSGAYLICYVYSQGAFAGASQSHKGIGKPHQCTPKRIPLIPEGALMHCCREDCPPVYLRPCHDQHQTQLENQERAASFLETQCHTWNYNKVDKTVGFPKCTEIRRKKSLFNGDWSRSILIIQIPAHHFVLTLLFFFFFFKVLAFAFT